MVNKRNYYGHADKSMSIGYFFSYVYSLMFVGILILSITSISSGLILFNLYKTYKVFTPWVFFIGILIISIMSSVTKYFLQTGLRSNSVTKSFFLFIISALLTGITLCPIMLFGFIMGFDNILIALGISSVFFLILSIVAIRSRYNFSPIGSLLIVGSLLLLLLSFVKFCLYFVNPFWADKLDLLHSVIGVVLSVGFVLFKVSKLKQLYKEFSHKESSRTLMNLGIVGASMLLDSFVMMFIFIFKLLVRLRRNNDK